LSSEVFQEDLHRSDECNCYADHFEELNGINGGRWEYTFDGAQ